VNLYMDWHAANISNIGKYGGVKLGYTSGKLEEAKTITDKALKELEDVFLSKHKFVARDETLTLAALALPWPFLILDQCEYKVTEKVTEKYIKSVMEEPGLKEAVDNYAKLLQVWIDDFNSKKEGEKKSE